MNPGRDIVFSIHRQYIAISIQYDVFSIHIQRNVLMYSVLYSGRCDRPKQVVGSFILQDSEKQTLSLFAPHGAVASESCLTKLHAGIVKPSIEMYAYDFCFRSRSRSHRRSSLSPARIYIMGISDDLGGEAAMVHIRSVVEDRLVRVCACQCVRACLCGRRAGGQAGRRAGKRKPRCGFGWGE